MSGMQRYRISRTNCNPRTARSLDKIRDLIIEKKPTSEIKRAAYEEGMTSCVKVPWPKCWPAKPHCGKSIR
jgi:hypothetical protein